MIVTAAALRPKSGDLIRNEETGEAWIAEMCRDCNGSGLASSGYLLTFKCPACQGLKIVWKIATFPALTEGKTIVESS